MPRIAIPVKDNLNFFGDDCAEHAFSQSVALWQAMGAEIHRVDISPMLDAARLLYEGAWVAERYIAAKSMIQSQPEAIHPVVRKIISAGENKSAIDGFENEYAMQGYRRLAAELLKDVDFLMTPTAPRTYTIEEMLDDPIVLNSNMGYYTNYMNLLDLCGVAVPAGDLGDEQKFGITLIDSKFQEQKLLGYAKLWQESQFGHQLGATKHAIDSSEEARLPYHKRIDVVVCGAHLEGMPLNWQLVERGAILQSKTQSAACYRLFALAGGPPYRPAMVYDSEGGAAIEVEVWSVPAAHFGSFVAGIPSPLGIGKLKLQDGRELPGFICEQNGVDGAEEITEFGGWRAYMSNRPTG